MGAAAGATNERRDQNPQNTMEWLILAENQPKAAALRKALPEATCMSSKGLPWTIDAYIEGPEIGFHIRAKVGYKETLANIVNAAECAQRVLLAFEGSTSGEATAKCFEDLLGREKCARWEAEALDPETIKKAILDLEGLRGTNLPKAKSGWAESHWMQATMDVIWAEVVSQWITKHWKDSGKMTRITASVLKRIDEQHMRADRFHPKKYYQLTFQGAKPGSKTSWQMEAIVPTLSHLAEAGERTRCVWKRKIQEAKEAAGQGEGTGQPEPGQPWRYENWEEAASQKVHMQKFPYMLVESVAEKEGPEEGGPPLTWARTFEIATKTGRATPEEIRRALTNLYHRGWITQPRTNTPKLKAKTVEALARHQSNTDPVPRDFGPGMGRGNEAIRPTVWERTPEAAARILGAGLESWLYREIHTKAAASQAVRPNETKWKAYATGPLHVGRKQARENRGERFSIDKEKKLWAHMTILCATTWETGTRPQPGDVVECRKMEIHEKQTTSGACLTEQELFEKMSEEGWNKPERLASILGELEKENLIRREKTVRLTARGKSLIRLLTTNFGQFLDRNYHRTVGEALKAVEENKTEGADFLREWWECLKTHLEEHTGEIENPEEEPAQLLYANNH
jgi:DNA topoisomerase IA